MISTTLQSKLATLGKAKDSINGVIESFEQLRCEVRRIVLYILEKN